LAQSGREFYAGADIGRMADRTFDYYISSESAMSVKTDSTSYRLYLGKKLGNAVSIELEYGDLGTQKGFIDSTGSPVAVSLSFYGVVGTLTLRNLFGSSHEASNNSGIFWRMGLGVLSYGGNGAKYLEGDSMVLSPGLGFRYLLTENLGLNVSFTAYLYGYSYAHEDYGTQVNSSHEFSAAAIGLTYLF
jgi:hypothetical protein